MIVLKPNVVYELPTDVSANQVMTFSYFLVYGLIWFCVDRHVA